MFYAMNAKTLDIVSITFAALGVVSLGFGFLDFVPNVYSLVTGFSCFFTALVAKKKNIRERSEKKDRMN